MTEPAAPRPDARNFWMRIAAALVLAPLALLLAYLGGLFWTVLVIAVAFILLWEWNAIVGLRATPRLAAGLFALLLAGVATALGRLDLAMVCVALGAFGYAIAGASRRSWAALGLVYAATPLIAALVLRRDPAEGFSAMLFVLLVVWATDTGGYFVGRRIGGPKLAPRISPKKTWSGAAGGLLGSLAVAAVFVIGFGYGAALIPLAGLLSVAAQGGDLLESGVKRRFGVKDSGALIPGHGGLLDRLDGFVTAALVAAVLGTLRAGPDGAASGLMLW